MRLPYYQRLAAKGIYPAVDPLDSNVNYATNLEIVARNIINCATSKANFTTLQGASGHYSYPGV
ncbi:hypothetical protein HID58_090126 [Brassica napus]|uniref:Uncharacterized protein n=1 Tax=Brassica napus TaxID=3708 RepID=A0ABQ7XE33_BRANA|nr:hypothetical protein HID58_090126 [Brassica napus]